MFAGMFKRGSSKTPQSNQQQVQAPVTPVRQPSQQQQQQPLQATKSPEEQRKEDLAAARDQQLPLIASQLYQSLRAGANQQAEQYLLTSKEALALRDSVMQAATAKVEANIDSDGTATAEEKADAKKYAKENVEKARIVEQSLKKLSLDTVSGVVDIANRQMLQDKAKEGYDSVAPKMKTALEKQKAEAQKQAIKTGQSAMESKLSELTTQIKTGLAQRIKADASFLNGSIDVQDTGKSEVEQRHALNDTLVADSVIDTLYTNKLFDPIKLAVVMKLGYERGFFSTTSDETKAFVKKLATAANDQARADIDSQLDTDTNTSGKSELGKKYYGMLAKVQAQSLSKGSVNTVVENKAIEIAKQVLPEAGTKGALKTAAQSSAYEVARANSGDAEKIAAAAKKGAQIKAIELLKAKQTEAVAAARAITKGKKDDKGVTVAPADTVKQGEMAQGVKDQVKTDEIGKKSIKQAIESDTLNGGFAKVGKVIDLAVPNVGDSSSFDFELKIPVDQTGSVYVLFGLAAEAEREQADGGKTDLTVNAQITFGAGFQTWGLDANFRAGLFMESQAKDSVGVMKLLSYGMYREMRNIAPRAAEFFWGEGGKSGMSKTDESELWAAMVEQTHMKEGNYVDVGLMTKLQGDINAGVAKMGGELGYKRLHHYDQETIEDRVKDHNTAKGIASPVGKTGFGDNTDIDKLGEKASALGFKANKHVWEAGATAEVKLGGTSVGFGLEGSLAFVNGRLRNLEISAKGSIPFAYGEDVSEWAKIASKWVTPIVGGAKNVAGLLQSKMRTDQEGVKKGIGGALDTGSDIMFTLPQFDSVGKGLVEKIQGDETINDTVRGWLTGNPTTSATEQVNKILLSSTLDLSLGFEKEWKKDGTPKEWEIALEAAETKTFEIDAEIVKVSVEKSKSLGKLGFGTNEQGELEFKGAFLGFET
ncbi:hypothetical protein [Cohnella fermenti]|uniref:Uncharacterized protein n=1 Tax=Cohnella fermenti TaxID=2565925 RepID=A0A4S4BPQ8_9BACL|nr:hypothetical protein [Cohnella fermenti]THF76867.1 hypothetical protein E6C55_17535 [Cohnella fermenti]